MPEIPVTPNRGYDSAKIVIFTFQSLSRYGTIDVFAAHYPGSREDNSVLNVVVTHLRSFVALRMTKLHSGWQGGRQDDASWVA